jgi:hypothetical protein
MKARMIKKIIPLRPVIMICLLIGLPFKGQAQIVGTENIYVDTNGQIMLHPGAQLGIFGNIINDASGGFNHNNGGDVYLFNHTTGIKEIIDGPNSTIPTTNYNDGGSFVRFYNLFTDNIAASGLPSGTIINGATGTGDINFKQEVRVSNLHTFVNGMIWTPRANWQHAFLHYDSENAGYTGNDPNNSTASVNFRKHVDGYLAKTGSTNFMFPIGDGIYTRFSGLSNPNFGIYKSAYFAKNAPDNGTTGISGLNAQPDNILNVQPGITKVNRSEFWDIDGTASSNYIITALNSIPNYSEWGNAVNFASQNASDIIITGFDIWQNLGINAAPISMLSDATYTTTLPTVPDNTFSVYTWANKTVFKTNPDINITSIAIGIFGDLNTNDDVNTGTTYGNPVTFGTNPSIDMPIINSDGTYSFTSAIAGQYNFIVNVCPPTIVADCPTQILSITVIDTTSIQERPTVNTDIVTVVSGGSIIIYSLANDQGGYILDTLVPGSVSIIAPPNNGTATVDLLTGNIIYLSNSGFIGLDTIIYSVCDNQTIPKCETAMQIINVIPIGALNTTTVSDDYNITYENISVNGNVLLNDMDAQGNLQSTIAQTASVAGKGTFVLGANGGYTFTPAPNYSGPVSFVYTTCDNAIPSVCSDATIYFYVFPSIYAPLTIDDRDVKIFNNNCVTSIDWTRTNESDIDYFVVYRKGEIDIAPINITTLDAQNLNSIDYQYHVKDTLMKSGRFIYTLSSVSYGKMESIIITKEIYNNCDGATLITVFPNPVNDNLSINLSNGILGKYQFRILNIKGQIIYESETIINNSEVNINVPMNLYAPGTYYLEVGNITEKKTFKIIKQ